MVTDLLGWAFRNPEWFVGAAHWLALVALIVLVVVALAQAVAKGLVAALAGALAWRILRGSVAGGGREGKGWRGRHSPLYRSHVQGQSPAWRALRAKVLTRAGGRCEGCGRVAAPLEVHHLTYERLGCERLSDLTGLCGACHRRAHQRRPAHTPKRKKSSPTATASSKKTRGRRVLPRTM